MLKKEIFCEFCKKYTHKKSLDIIDQQGNINSIKSFYSIMKLLVILTLKI